MKQILVVDDELEVARTIKTLVESAGYAVSISTNPLNAVPMAKGFDLLLLDALMPQVSGPEFLALIKKARVKIPIIIVTVAALPSKTVKEISDSYPGIEFVPKTHMSTDLISAIKAKIGSP